MRSQIYRTALVVWIPAAVIMAVALVASLATESSMRHFTQDATTVLDAPFYVGSISNIGVVLWSMTVALCLFVALGLRGRISDEWRRFMLASGVFTAVLLIDDLLLIHDEILPRYARISGELYGVLYVVAIAAYLVYFRPVIRRTNYALLGIALGLFGISTVVDLGSGTLSEIVPTRFVVLVEDGAKLLAIGTWLAYFAYVARDLALAPTSRSELEPGA